MYIHGIDKSLIYVLVLDKKGYIVEFMSKIVVTNKGNISMKCYKSHNVYSLNIDIDIDNIVSISNYLNVSTN